MALDSGNFLDHCGKSVRLSVPVPFPPAILNGSDPRDCTGSGGCYQQRLSFVDPIQVHRVDYPADCRFRWYVSSGLEVGVLFFVRATSDPEVR